jgi:hypothetical protein
MRKTSTATKTKAGTRAHRTTLSRKVANGRPSVARKNSHVNVKAKSPSSDLDSSNDLLRTVPLTTEDRLAHIHALGQRVGSYVKFMCTVARLEGSSAESKERAVSVFYDRLYILEQELSRIHDSLLLG